MSTGMKENSWRRTLNSIPGNFEGENLSWNPALSTANAGNPSLSSRHYENVTRPAWFPGRFRGPMAQPY